MKTILLHLENSPQNEPCLQAALALAKDRQARVIGYFPLPALSYYGYQMVPSAIGFIQELQSTAREKAKEIGRWFGDQCEKAGVPYEFCLDDDNTVAGLAVASRVADIVIIGQADNAAASQRDPHFSADDLVLATACPVLIVPARRPVTSIGRRIVIAWNGSREASRAVHDALPLLRQAERVFLLVANPPPDIDSPGADVARYLGDHDVAVELHCRPVAESGVAAAIAEIVTSEYADLLVMGAWGHSRLREFVLGGTTRDILRHMPTAVLMSH